MRPASSRTCFHPAPLTLAIAMALGTPCLAFAQTAGSTSTQRAPIAIAAQPLASALNELAASTGVPVSFPPALVEGKTAPAVSGNLTAQQAAERLLTGSGLAATSQGGTLIIRTAAPVARPAPADGESITTLPEVAVLDTAEDEIRQQLSVSIITREEIERRPPANDLADLIRTQPGVNLTGNSSYGQYGNNRELNLRGMGAENTLILIDGKPVHSREASFMGLSGERDTRGDANWVPVNAVERIEVIRGAAAARYGSGAAGGVVNIITKKPGKVFSGSVTAYTDIAGNSDEQETRRLGFNLSGPVTEDLSFRLYGNVAKTSADAADINAAASGVELTDTTIPPAGREGVRNRDINALLRWDLNPQHVLEFEAGISRQGNIYAGELATLPGGATTGNSADAAVLLAAAGAETNSTIRRTASLTHRGRFDFGSSRTILQYEGTDRRYMSSIDTALTPSDKIKSELENLFFQSELNAPLTLAGKRQVLTAGVELRRQRMDDANPMLMTDAGSSSETLGIDPDGSRTMKETWWSLYLEDNIELSDSFILTPGVRMDHTEVGGTGWSPSLNASWQLSPSVSVKGGIARAFKAPNLYQTNPNYLYSGKNLNCPYQDGYSGMGFGCYIQGNPDLKTETSLNKEIGIAFNGDNGLDASLTYYHNDYKNRIHAEASADFGWLYMIGSDRVFRWANASKAVVQGLEGNLSIPLLGHRGSTLRLLNNFTYNIQNENTVTGQPLSVIPKYNINSTLDWRITEQWSAQLTGTFYGRQEPRSLNSRGVDAAESNPDALNARPAYHLFGLSTQYEFSKNLRANFGVNNLFNKRQFREGMSSEVGAATYNEPGRSYYLSVTASF